jgi:hypothetical protein
MKRRHISIIVRTEKSKKGRKKEEINGKYRKKKLM